MNVGQLIDGIVRQTTVLVAQVSTAAGLRAPLSHIADQVFYELAREIEAQGVRRKVVADMFGLALRTYQKKIRRLSGSATVRDRTLWEAVLEYIRERGPLPRSLIEERFQRDPKPELAAVLQDLVGGGLIYSTGRGPAAIFGITSAADQAILAATSNQTALAHLIWITIHQRRSLSFEELVRELRLDEEPVRDALDALIADGRVSASDEDNGEPRFTAPRLLIPVGAEQGWEVAVFDHYTAVCAAIVAKLRLGRSQSTSADVIGGATLRFDLHPGHPFEAEVNQLLATTRARTNALWDRVTSHNRAHPIDPASATRVTFYFGQYVEEPSPETDSLEGPTDDEVQQ